MDKSHIIITCSHYYHSNLIKDEFVVSLKFVDVVVYIKKFVDVVVYIKDEFLVSLKSLDIVLYINSCRSIYQR
jgi:hypothetical protein